MMGQAVEILLAILVTAAGGASGGPIAPPSAPDKPVRPASPLNLLAPIAGGTTPSKPDVYDLRPAGDGSGDLLYDATTFSARVARDGSVTFKDVRIRMLKLFEPFLPKAGPRNVPSLFTTINSLARNRGVPTVDENAQTDDSYLIMPNQTRYRPDWREGCRNCPRPYADAVPVMAVGGRFDLTDEVMRFSGQDPYRYEKAKFLAGTRELRVGMAVKTHRENLRRAAEALPPLLEQLACDAGRSFPERRAIIEKLREELDDATAEGHAAAELMTTFLSRRFGTDGGAPTCP